MKTKFFVVLIICLFFLSCNQSSGPEENPAEISVIKQNLDLQAQIGQKYNSLLSILAEDQAKDSILKLFLAETGKVESAWKEASGISVKYKNGQFGGVSTTNSLSGQKGAIAKISNNIKVKHGDKTNISYAILPHKQNAVFLAPNYSYWTNYDNKVKDVFTTAMANVHDIPVTFLRDNQVTVDILCTLGNYGLIHISSHGYDKKNRQNPDLIDRSFLMTGEIYSEPTFLKYLSEFNADKLLIIYSAERKTNMFYITPEFIKDRNTFDGTNFIFGSFCFSYTGGWPSLAGNNVLGGFMGYNWSVNVEKDTGWACHFYRYLGDTSKTVPAQISDWFSKTPDIPKSYYYPEEGKNVYINYNGQQDLQFWKRIEINSVNPNYGQVGTQIRISGSGFGNSKGTSYVTLNGSTAQTNLWSDTQIEAVIPPNASTGNILVFVNGRKSNPYLFYVGSQPPGNWMQEIKSASTVTIGYEWLEIIRSVGQINSFLYIQNYYTSGSNFPINWSGNTFTPQVDVKPFPSDANSRYLANLSGTISADGLMMTNATATLYVSRSDNGVWEQYDKISLKDIPICPADSLRFQVLGKGNVNVSKVPQIDYWKKFNGSVVDTVQVVNYSFSTFNPRVYVQFAK